MKKKSSAMSDNRLQGGRKELERCAVLACSFELIDRKEMRDLKTQPDPVSVVFLLVYEVKNKAVHIKL